MGNEITYNPGAVPLNEHPLNQYGREGGSYCVDNAQLLKGLFRSIGQEAEVEHVWSGSGGGASAQMYFYKTASGNDRGFQLKVNAKPKDGLSENPHFKFHANVTSGDTLFDPSYGLTGFTSLNFIEAVSAPPYKLVWENDSDSSTTPNDNQQTRLDYHPPEEVAEMTGVVCPHQE